MDGNEMRLEGTEHKPALLMLSHCFPDPDGPPQAARAWRILCCAAHTHRVYLSAVADRPVNLHLWRRVDDYAQRIHIIGKRPIRATPKPYSGEAVTWTNQLDFDALFATAPQAWPVVFPHGIGVAVCDVGNGEIFEKQQAGHSDGILTKLRPSRSRPSTTDILSACDRVTLASWNEAWQLPGQRWKVRLLPDDDMPDAWNRLFPAKPDLHDTAPELTVLNTHQPPLRQAA